MTDVKILGNIHGKHKKFIEINGKKYAEVKTDIDRKGKAEVTFREFDDKKFEEDLEKMAKLLAPKVDAKEIVKQALRDIPLEDFEKVQQEFNKEKPQVQSRGGCVYLKIGKGNKSPVLYLRA